MECISYISSRHAPLTGAYLTGVHLRGRPYLSRHARIVCPADKPSNCLSVHPETALKVVIQIGDSKVRWIINGGPPALTTMCVRKNPTSKLLRAEIAFRSCVPDTSRDLSRTKIDPRVRTFVNSKCEIHCEQRIYASTEESTPEIHHRYFGVGYWQRLSKEHMIENSVVDRPRFGCYPRFVRTVQLYRDNSGRQDQLNR